MHVKTSPVKCGKSVGVCNDCSVQDTGLEHAPGASWAFWKGKTDPLRKASICCWREMYCDLPQSKPILSDFIRMFDLENHHRVSMREVRSLNDVKLRL